MGGIESYELRPRSEFEHRSQTPPIVQVLEGVSDFVERFHDALGLLVVHLPMALLLEAGQAGLPMAWVRQYQGMSGNIKATTACAQPVRAAVSTMRKMLPISSMPIN